MKVNIACGGSYLPDWYNYDYSSDSALVHKANLLDVMPIKDMSAEIVYSSHFLEHIPREFIGRFVSECFRITKHGGYLRLVLPDLEELCTTYLAARHANEHLKADFLTLELLDQCVRSNQGGDLGLYYEDLLHNKENSLDMIEYVKFRTGHIVMSESSRHRGNIFFRFLKNPKRIINILERYYCRLIILLLPKAFRRQNISLAEIGEKHAWVYDFYTVEKLLRKAGFVDIQRMTSKTSNIESFPFHPLDLLDNGQPRKGSESMYIEARKC